MVILGSQKTVELPKAVQEEMDNLRGFRDLMAERTGYYLGRKAKQAEMNTATKTERKTAGGIRTVIRESIPTWIAESNVSEYEKQTSLLSEASKVVSEKSKPFRVQIKPLTQAVKYIDNIAVPAVLEQLGMNLAPTFTLSDFIKAKLEEQKNN